MAVTAITFASASGGALYVTKLVNALARQGLETSLICPEDFEHQNNLDPRVQTLTFNSRAPGGWRKMFERLSASLTIPWSLKRHPKKRLVHLNFVEPAAITILLVLGLKALGFTTVYTVHDVMPHRWLWPRPFRPLERGSYLWLYRHCDRLVVHHQGACDELANLWKIDPKKISVIPHGELSLETGPAAYPQTGELTVLAFGTIRNNKGLHLTIPAIQILREAGCAIRLVIAGQPYRSEREYWQGCQKQIAQAPEGIQILDHYISEEQAGQLIAQNHVFALPYLEFHSQSGVALLALSNARPIIATRSGGLTDLLQEGQTGFEIREATVNGVRDALQQALTAGPEKLKAMGQAARQEFLARFSWEVIATRYHQLYQEI